MLYTSNSQAINFIQGLSRMWRSLFSQSAELETAYKAAEQLWAQAYLDILQDMKGVSLEAQNVFRRLLFQHDTIDDASCFEVEGFLPNTNRYLFPVLIEDKGWKVNKINYIGNSLVAPTAFLELGVDFEMVLDGSVALQTYRGREPSLPDQDYIAFYENPFTNVQFKKKQYDESFFNIASPIGPSVDYTGLGVVAGDFLRIYFDASGRVFDIPITSVATSQLTFDTAFLRVMDTNLERLALRGFRFEVLDATRVVKVSSVRGRFLSETKRVNAIALWYADALVDDYSLSQVYGELLGAQETSTENYKKLLRGLLQYYVRGNSIARTTSAVHVIAGLPVFDTAGETVGAITTTGAQTTILTDQTLYLTDNAHPLRDDVLKAAASIDGHTPDDAARWAVFPRGIDLKLLNVNSGHKLVIDDGGGTGVPQTVDIIKVYNQRRLLISSSTAVTAGEGTYYGFSVGDNATAYDNLIPNDTARPLIIENFTRQASDFSDLAPLTSAVEIVDHVEEPLWWEGKQIPRDVFDEPDTARRTMGPDYYPAKIGTPGVKIGDPMFKVGADEEKRAPYDPGAVIEVPYFHKALTNNKDFRRGEMVSSIMGHGDGEGRVLWHNQVRNILYVKVVRGRFFTGDLISGSDSLAQARTAARSRITIDGTTTGLPLATFSATGGGAGTATGVVAYLLGPHKMELYEKPGVRTTAPTDTITVGGVSRTVLQVEEMGFALSHRGAAAYLMDNLWKNGIIHISYDFTSFEFPRGLKNLRELVTQGAEGRVYVFIEPFTSFIEVVPPPTETLALSYARVFSEEFPAFDTNIRINGPKPGGGTWQIGDTGYIIGGTNPAYDATNLEGYAGGAAVADLTIGIVITP